MGIRLVNPAILGSLEHVGRAPSLSARPDHGDLRERDRSLGGGSRCWGKDSQGGGVLASAALTGCSDV